MRSTFNLDDELIGEAQRLTGLTERTALIHEGLRALIERESARRLARLGATEPALRTPPRRRPRGAARRKRSWSTPRSGSTTSGRETRGSSRR